MAKPTKVATKAATKSLFWPTSAIGSVLFAALTVLPLGAADTHWPEFDGHLVDFDLLMDRLSTYREFEQQALAACEGGTCKIGLK